MNTEKNMSTRIIHKHDIEANWNKATNFIPKQGELIVYDPDENCSYQRIKIGDGTTKINDLNFTKASGYVAQPEAPYDTSLFWLDTDDDTVDGGGGVSSWNDLTDKPFYLETTTIDPIFNGNLTDREIIEVPGIGYAVKMTPEYVPVSDMIGASMTYVLKGVENHYLLTAENTVDATQLLGAPGTAILNGGDIQVVSLPTETTAMGATLSAGTWFGYIPNEFYVKSISCLKPFEGEPVEKIEPNCLPTGYPYEEIIDINTTFDGNYKERDFIWEDEEHGLYVIKISSEVPSVDELIGSTYICHVNGIDREYTIEESNIWDLRDFLGVPVYMLDRNGNSRDIYFVEQDCTFGSMSLSAGTWYTGVDREGDYEYAKFLSCLQDKQKIVHKLNNKFIDAEWMATSEKGKGNAILDETILSFEDTSEGKISYISDFIPKFVVGKDYVVSINGIPYITKCIQDSCLGGSIESAFATEPFFIMSIEHDVDLLPGTYIGLDSTYGRSTSYSIGIYECKDTTTKLPMKFLPEGYPYIENVSINPTFDGNLIDKESIMVGLGAYLVKISPQIITIDDAVGATMIVSVEGEEDDSVILTDEMVLDGTDIMNQPGICITYKLYDNDEMVIFSLQQDSFVEGFNVTAGTWILYIENTFYVKSLSCLDPIEMENVHKIDNKFIDAEWMATSTKGKGKVIFEEIERVADSDSDNTAIFNCQPSLELKTGTYIVSYNGHEYTVQCNRYVESGIELYIIICGALVIITIPDHDITQIQMKDISPNDTFTLGIYEYDDIASKIPLKYLPDGYPNSEIKQVSIFGDDLEGKETISVGSGAYFVKASTEYVTVDDLIGHTMTGMLNGSEITLEIDSSIVMDASALFGFTCTAIIIENQPALLSVPEDTISDGLLFSKGTWYTCQPGIGYVKSISYFPDITKEVITKLDERYLPDNAVTEEEYNERRTHWTDDDGTVHKLDNKYIDSEWLAVRESKEVAVELLPETTLTVKSVSASSAYTNMTVAVESDIIPTLQIGQNMTVIMDGITYNSTIWKSTRTPAARCFGNSSLSTRYNTTDTSVSDNSEPFLFVFLPNTSNAKNKLYVVVSDTSVGHTFSITFTETVMVPVTIPVEFLPSDVNLGSGLPEVTVDNNNQSLKVVDGVWEVTDLSYNDLSDKPIPTVTTENNGAFLRVVDGQWAAVMMPNIEDGEF